MVFWYGVFFFLTVSLFAEPLEPNLHTFYLGKTEHAYVLPDDPLTDEQRQAFQDLSPDAQARFLKIRGRLFQKSVVALEKVFGAEKIQSALELANEQLWQHAPLIAAGNEIGVAVQAGGEAGGLVNKTGLFGVTAANLSGAVDPIDKGVVLEFYWDAVKANRALPFYVGAGGFGSVLFSINQRDWKKPLKIEKAEGFAAQAEGLLAVAVAGSATPNNFRIGVSAGGGFGFPPVVALTTDGYRVPIFAVGAFKKWPYVRMQVVGSNKIKTALKAPLQILAWSCRSVIGKLRGSR